MPYVNITCKGKDGYVQVPNARYVSRIPMMGELVSFDLKSGSMEMSQVLHVVHKSSETAESYKGNMHDEHEVEHQADAELFCVLCGENHIYFDGAVRQGEEPYSVG